MSSAFGECAFVCNLCRQRGVFRQAHYDNPELPSCLACGSNVRFRWLVHTLSLELFGRSLPLPEFPSEKSITGIGLTDPPQIAAVLADRFRYCNTYLTNEPKLDIRGDPSPFGKLDFLIASEVFEHVEPPVAPAFANAASMLKPWGVLLMTVPWVWDGDAGTAIPDLYDWRLARENDCHIIVNRKRDGQVEQFREMAFDGSPGPSLGRTREHFPQLQTWHLSDESGSPLLQNKRTDGTLETYRNLVFHEGPGLSLEMRLFTKHGIDESLRAAGFRHFRFATKDHPELGIIFGRPWTRPIVARI